MEKKRKNHRHAVEFGRKTTKMPVTHEHHKHTHDQKHFTNLHNNEAYKHRSRNTIKTTGPAEAEWKTTMHIAGFSVGFVISIPQKSHV